MVKVVPAGGKAGWQERESKEEGKKRDKDEGGLMEKSRLSSRLKPTKYNTRPQLSMD